MLIEAVTNPMIMAPDDNAARAGFNTERRLALDMAP
jgi:hypothetical protein